MLVLLLLIFVTLLAGSTIKGAIGLGLPLIAIPVLSLSIGVPKALAIIMIPTLATNFLQVRQFWPDRKDTPFLPPFLLFGAFGIAGGTWLLAIASPRTLEVLLALAVILYLAMRLARPDFRLSVPLGTRIAPAAGLGAGLLQGSTGISSPVIAVFFHSLHLARGTFMFCTAAMFMVFGAVQLTLLAVAGIATAETFLLGLFALIPAFLGLPIGNWLGQRLSPALFDRFIMVLLAVTVVPLLYRGFFG